MTDKLKEINWCIGRLSDIENLKYIDMKAVGQVIELLKEYRAVVLCEKNKWMGLKKLILKEKQPTTKEG